MILISARALIRELGRATVHCDVRRIEFAVLYSSPDGSHTSINPELAVSKGSIDCRPPYTAPATTE